jgi:hypothetical protein
MGRVYPVYATCPRCGFRVLESEMDYETGGSLRGRLVCTESCKDDVPEESPEPRFEVRAPYHTDGGDW